MDLFYKCPLKISLNPLINLPPPKKNRLNKIKRETIHSYFKVKKKTNLNNKSIHVY